jgi:hypothetical protein
MSELLRPEIKLMFFVVGNYNDDKNNKDLLNERGNDGNHDI